VKSTRLADSLFLADREYVNQQVLSISKPD